MDRMLSCLILGIEALAFLLIAESSFSRRFRHNFIYVSPILFYIIFYIEMSHFLVFENMYYKTILILLANFFMLCLLLFRRKQKNENQSMKMSMLYWGQVLIIPVGMILNLCLLVFYALKENETSIWVIIDGMFIIAGAIYFFYLKQKLENERQTKSENQELYRQIQSGKRQASLLLEKFQKERRLTHDFQGHLNTLSGLMKSHNYKEAEKYLDKLCQSNLRYQAIINTNNPIIDAMLNQYYQEVKRKSIAIEFELTQLQKIPVSDEEIVIILSNLFDNAIEASEELPADQRRMIQKMQHDDCGFIISMRNRFNQRNLEEITEIETMKKDKEVHGYGLQNIKCVINKYSGNYAIERRQGWFQFTIILPDKNPLGTN